jgi:hypothetical protein
VLLRALAADLRGGITLRSDNPVSTYSKIAGWWTGGVRATRMLRISRHPLGSRTAAARQDACSTRICRPQLVANCTAPSYAMNLVVSRRERHLCVVISAPGALTSPPPRVTPRSGTGPSALRRASWGVAMGYIDSSARRLSVDVRTVVWGPELGQQSAFVKYTVAGE